MANPQAKNKLSAWDLQLGANIEFRRKRMSAIASRLKFSQRLQAIGCHLSVDQIGDIERGDRACTTEELHFIASALDCHEDDLKPNQTGVSMTLDRDIKAAVTAQTKAQSSVESPTANAVTKLLRSTAIAAGVSEKLITESLTGEVVFQVNDIPCSLSGSERQGIALKVNHRIAERYAHPDSAESALPIFSAETLKPVLVSAIAATISRTQAAAAEPVTALDQTELQSDPQP